MNLGLALYSVEVVIAAIDGEDAVRWAEEQHRQSHDRYARGTGNGGRFVPAEAIRVAAMVAAALAKSDWTMILGHVASQQEVAFPAGELLTAAGAYRDGRITLAGHQPGRHRQQAAGRRCHPPGPGPLPGAGTRQDALVTVTRVRRLIQGTREGAGEFEVVSEVAGAQSNVWSRMPSSTTLSDCILILAVFSSTNYLTAGGLQSEPLSPLVQVAFSTGRSLRRYVNAFNFYC